MVGHDGTDRVALAVVGLLSQEDDIRVLGLENLGKGQTGGADIRADEGVVGKVDRTVSTERDSLLKGALGRTGAHRDGDYFVNCKFAAFFELHGSLNGVGIEGIEVVLAATIEPHGAGVDALLYRGVWYLFHQDADLQVKPP